MAWTEQRGYATIIFHGIPVIKLSEYNEAGMDIFPTMLIAPDELWSQIEKQLQDEFSKKIQFRKGEKVLQKNSNTTVPVFEVEIVNDSLPNSDEVWVSTTVPYKVKKSDLVHQTAWEYLDNSTSVYFRRGFASI